MISTYFFLITEDWYQFFFCLMARLLSSSAMLTIQNVTEFWGLDDLLTWSDVFAVEQDRLGSNEQHVSEWMMQKEPAC